MEEGVTIAVGFQPGETLCAVSGALGAGQDDEDVARSFVQGGSEFVLNQSGERDIFFVGFFAKFDEEAFGDEKERSFLFCLC